MTFEYKPEIIGQKTVNIIATPKFLSAPSIISALPEIAARIVVTSGSLNVENSAYPNFSNLRIWGLIERIKVGHYRITDLGRQFLANNVSLPLVAYVSEGALHRFDGPQVFYKDVVGGANLRAVA